MAITSSDLGSSNFAPSKIQTLQFRKFVSQIASIFILIQSGHQRKIMFDLNELPQDDFDMLPPPGDVGCMQPARDSKARCMQVNEPEDSFVRPCCEVGNAEISLDRATLPVHLVDLAPLPLGQHPLSSFRPFVRSIDKRELSNGAMLNAKEGACLKSMLDQQILATSCALNGEHSRIEHASSKQTAEAALVTSDSCGCIGSHHTSRPKDCDEIVPRRKDEHVQKLPGFSMDVQEMQETLSSSTIVQAPEEVQEKVSLRSALVDACVKIDVSRGSSIVESKAPSSFVKRGRLDQKDAMLGKKRARQTMFLDVREAAKQAPPPKASTVKKSSSLSSFRNYKEVLKTPVPSCTIDAMPKDPKSSSPSSDEFMGRVIANSSGQNVNNLAFSVGIVADGQAKSQGLVLPSSTDEVVEGVSLAAATTPARHSSLKGVGNEKGEGPQLNKPVVGRHPGGSQGKLDGEVKPASYVRPLAKKNLNNYRKQTLYSQDSSIERLHREATCEKLWKSPAATSMLSPVERRLCVCILLQSRVAITWSRQCLLTGKIAANGA